MTRQEFIEKLNELEIDFMNELSYIYGSDYYTFKRGSVRVSDHSKNENSFCYNSYKLGINDFRSYEEAFNKLSDFCNVNVKEDRIKFYKENEDKLIEVTLNNEILYKNGLGGLFDKKENALNNWFRLTYNF